jgi:hypothetical protein
MSRTTLHTPDIAIACSEYLTGHEKARVLGVSRTAHQCARGESKTLLPQRCSEFCEVTKGSELFAIADQRCVMELFEVMIGPELTEKTRKTTTLPLPEVRITIGKDREGRVAECPLQHGRVTAAKGLLRNAKPG